MMIYSMEYIRIHWYVWYGKNHGQKCISFVFQNHFFLATLRLETKMRNKFFFFSKNKVHSFSLDWAIHIVKFPPPMPWVHSTKTLSMTQWDVIVRVVRTLRVNVCKRWTRKCPYAHNHFFRRNVYSMFAHAIRVSIDVLCMAVYSIFIYMPCAEYRKKNILHVPPTNTNSWRHFKNMCVLFTLFCVCARGILMTW